MDNTAAQLDTFSEFATHRVHKIFKVYSTENRVNVVTPVITGNHAVCRAVGVGDAVGNHIFRTAPTGRTVREHVAACVAEVVNHHGWIGDQYELGPVEGRRGEYRVTLWTRK